MNLQGSAKRLITSPGYHIKPKYDPEGFRKKKEAASERDFDVVLPLTSMIDMFSMLVIFLLLNFSATGEAYFVNKNIKLPEASHARKLESLPLISITKKGIYLDTENKEIKNRVVHIDDVAMLPIVQELKRIRAIQDNMKQAGIKPKTQVNIQADRTTDVKYIKRVMNVLIENGFTGINFAVREKAD
jgi:biopolymer transport protein ExbD